ncbi:hypothetical protein MUO14_11910 [Halobacillus shinanisalinarum]|uniref:Uncharacterized protein n=1 Tax=Halobacillus shinanisalinarum TaxID=2932258 RepID=A0ABY4H548_9BACI|nr:hypothetical protein [Halobacillus shinanisalinarum]UOQ95558.1 hypothetical protein MUO14_11910 [Halobacillus shinanisalinarum]
MKKENQMFIILGSIGSIAILIAAVLFFTIQDPMIPVVILASGVLLIIGGRADQKERIKKRKRTS